MTVRSLFEGFEARVNQKRHRWGSVQPLSPDEKAFGLSLGEWAAAWRQWIFSIPSDTNPRNDTTGIRAGIGQRMPVWFLPGAPVGQVRTVTLIIPAGSLLLVPGPGGVELDLPGNRSEEELRAALEDSVGKQFLDRLTLLEVSVDGMLLPDLKPYRVQSPLFSIVLPPGNLAGISVTAGKDHRLAAVTEGYFLILPPLPVGKHAVVERVEGIDPDSNKPFKGLYTFNLVIQNPNDPLP